VAFLIPRLGIGALCHPMLPTQPRSVVNVAVARRYVDFAIRDLARQFDALGARRSEVRVKLFGGADVLTVSDALSRPTVGRLNRETALRVLDEEGFRVAASSLGGTSGINIRFHTVSGEVLLRRLG
jgi:chemotaxis protein CheD